MIRRLVFLCILLLVLLAVPASVSGVPPADAEYAVGELFGLKFKCVDVSMQFLILFFKLGDSFFEEWQMAQDCFVYYLVSHDGCVCRMNI